MECEQGVSRTNQSALIPGLPDDAFSCLARVPRKYIPAVHCVSKRWKELVCGEEFNSYRVKHRLDEAWIYALCRDKFEQLCLYVLDPNQLRSGWRRIHGIPDKCLKRQGIGFQVLGRKVYLFGGCCWVEDASDEVYCYDALTDNWSQASPLSTDRCYFACEALNGKIYSVGGFGSKLSNPNSYDVYDAQKNSWTSYEDPNIIQQAQDSMVLDGKIYIQCGYSSVSPHQVYAVVYEPSSGTWQHADTDTVSGWRGPAVVVDGVLYVLDHSSGVKLIMWEKKSREWVTLKRLSVNFARPPCRLVAVGKKIIIIGQWLSMAVFDIANIGHRDGVLLSSLVRKLVSDERLISCKSLAVRVSNVTNFFI